MNITFLFPSGKLKYLTGINAYIVDKGNVFRSNVSYRQGNSKLGTLSHGKHYLVGVIPTASCIFKK